MTISRDAQGRPEFGPNEGQPAEDARRARAIRLALGRPRLRTRSAGPDPAELEEIGHRQAIEAQDRLLQLMAFYRIDSQSPHSQGLLAYCLARDFVANFDVHKSSRVGPKTGQRKDLEVAFPRAVEEVAAARQTGIPEACQRLSKRGHWRGIKPSVLENRYLDARRLELAQREALLKVFALPSPDRQEAVVLQPRSPFLGLDDDNSSALTAK